MCYDLISSSDVSRRTQEREKHCGLLSFVFFIKMRSSHPCPRLALARDAGDTLQKGLEVSGFLYFNVIWRKPKPLAVNVWGTPGRV